MGRLLTEEMTEGKDCCQFSKLSDFPMMSVLDPEDKRMAHVLLPKNVPAKEALLMVPVLRALESVALLPMGVMPIHLLPIAPTLNTLEQPKVQVPVPIKFAQSPI